MIKENEFVLDFREINVWVSFFVVRTVPFRYANTFNSSLLNITLACFSFSLSTSYLWGFFPILHWAFVCLDDFSYRTTRFHLCATTNFAWAPNLFKTIPLYTNEQEKEKTDNNLQDESRIFVLSSKCPYTHRHIAYGHIEFAHIAMDIFGLYSMKMLFFSVESPVCELYCLSLFALTIFQVGKNGHSVQQAAIKWNYWIKTNLNSRDTRHDTTRTNNDLKVKKRNMTKKKKRRSNSSSTTTTSTQNTNNKKIYRKYL